MFTDIPKCKTAYSHISAGKLIQMSSLVLLVWELQFSSPKEGHVASLVFLLLPVAERPVRWQQSRKVFFPLAIPTVPLSSELGKTLHTQGQSGKSSDNTMNLILHCLGKPVCQV